MSTRCNVLVKDAYSEQWFYRHSDGYPSCTAESLKKFVQWLEDGKIRANVSQGSSWLIVLGNQESNEELKELQEREKDRLSKEGREKSESIYTHENFGGGLEPSGGSMGWKVGAYEVTDDQHGDIEWLYTIDLENKKVKVEYMGDNSKKVFSFKQFLKCNSEDLENRLSA